MQAPVKRELEGKDITRDQEAHRKTSGHSPLGQDNARCECAWRELETTASKLGQK